MSGAWWFTLGIASIVAAVLLLNPDPAARLFGFLGLAAGLGISGTLDIFRRKR